MKKYLGILLALGFVFGGMSFVGEASAQTTDDAGCLSGYKDSYLTGKLCDDIVPTGKATLRIKLDSIPDYSDDFSYTVQGTSYRQSFVLDDDQELTLPNTKTLQLAPGVYQLSQILTGWASTKSSDWNTKWSCSSLTSVSSLGDGSYTTVDIGVDKTVNCTYTNSLKANVPLPTPVLECANIINTLRYDRTGRISSAEVTTLQYFLRGKGYFTYNKEKFGNFDISTLEAVRAFQRDYGLTDDGVVGALTRRQIRALSCVREPYSNLPINVLSPNNNDNYKTDDLMTVKWANGGATASNGFRVSVHSLNKGANVAFSAFVSNDLRERNFRIPANTSAGLYKVVVHEVLKDSVFGVSGVFNITNAGVPVPILPSLILTSPNGGEVWKKGTVQSIKWDNNTTSTCEVGKVCTSPNPRRFDLKLTKHVQCMASLCPMIFPYSIAENVTSSYSWNVGTVKDLPGETVPDGSYTIQVCDTDSILGNHDAQCDSSDAPFTISSVAPTTPSIIVLSPNGGEEHQPGQEITVKWETSNNPYNPKNVSVLLYDSSGYNYYLSGNHYNLIDSPDTGSLIATLPPLNHISYNSGSPVKFIPGNNFKIRVAMSPMEYTSYEDSSDNLFSVVQTPTANPTDLTPRIMYWFGKVNQHVGANRVWQSDSDAISGANIDKLVYCKKWYPNTVSVENYKSETIDTWREANNIGQFTGTNLSYKCAADIY